MSTENRIRAIVGLSRKAFGKYIFQIIILTALGFLSGLLEGVGINAVIPLFSVITKESGGAGDIISQVIGKLFVFFGINLDLKYILIFISLMFVFKAAVLILSGYISAKISADYEKGVRSELFDKTLKSDWSYLLKQKVGYLENTLMVDIEFSANLLRTISSTIMILTSLSMYVLVAINISVYVTLITVSLGGMLFLLFKPLIYRTRIAAHEVTNANKQISHHVNERMIGVKTIKAMYMEDVIVQKASEYFNKLKKLKIRLFFLKNIANFLLQPISLIFICVVFAFSYKTPGFHFAALVAVIYLIQKIFQFIQQLQSNLHAMNESVPYLKNVLMCQDNAIVNEEKKHGSNNFHFNHALSFENVSFSYGGNKDTLTSVSFSVKKGEMVGIIGPSGAGKTTIVDLILRLFNPNTGKIFLDGLNIDANSIREWRKNIGYVSQDFFLINDTVANNIRFYNSSITDKEIAEASKMANIYDFIQECPNRFETVIGERGVMLSAGQRQRIAIARILVRKPKILILDEATSALDNESEVRIQQIIENLKGRITVLVIAHRLSTVVNCDRLMVLEKGKIIEQGSPDELLKDNKTYFYRVYNIRN